MLKLFSFLRNVLSLNKRLTAEERQQEKEGYSIKSVREGPEHYFIYREGKKEVAVGAEFTFLNDVKIYTNSFIKWNVPKNETMKDSDHQRILERLTRYFSCWGGNITFDNIPLQDVEDLKKLLNQQGISFKESDEVIIYEGTLKKK